MNPTRAQQLPTGSSASAFLVVTAMDYIGSACNTYGGDEKYIQNVGPEK
jgi:hypothetical protein